MMMYSINPRALPTKIYNSFRLLTTIRGRGVLLIIISSLFLDDKHAFHKSCAILLFIGGILYFICEILVPTTKDELDQIESIYNNIKKDTTSSRNENVSNTYNSTNPMNSSTIQNQDKSTEILENNPSNIIPNDNEGKANKNQNESEEQNIKTMNNNGNENKEYNGPNTKVEEEIVKKTDNPYEIPEDF
jgi:lipopolysaccharide export LptBFGC system permease protein LptF